MTNQASEDEQTKAIYEAMQIPYLSERHDAIKALIRTEKLKLLAEVKGRRSTTFLAPTHGVSIADLEELEAEL